MITSRHRQTSARFSEVRGCLSVSGVLSPYFQMIDTRKVGTDGDIRIIPKIMAISMYVFKGYAEDTPSAYGALVDFIDPSNIPATDRELLDLNLTGVVDAVTLQAATISAINAYITSAGYTITAAIVPWATNLPTPTSYQTIVSQTGTAAPAVSGGFTAASTYPAGTTFTWARTGAGVYTLTASSAVFSTSKTGVFVAPLQNLNASIRAVVTSSTVITVTTAVQSLAVLGLVGFTATNTDALLSGTMIYVQTYA